MFEEIATALRSAAPDADYAALADQLVSEASTISEGYSATLAEREAAIQQLRNEKAALQSHNYSLMMAKADAEPLKPEVDPESLINSVNDLF